MSAESRKYPIWKRLVCTKADGRFMHPQSKMESVYNDTAPTPRRWAMWVPWAPGWSRAIPDYRKHKAFGAGQIVPKAYLAEN